jgi:hypothetical protein
MIQTINWPSLSIQVPWGSPSRRCTCVELRRRSGAAKSPRPAGKDDERLELSSELGTGRVVHRPPPNVETEGDRRRRTRERGPLDWAMTQAPPARWGAVPSRRRPRRPRRRAGRAARRWTRQRCYWSGPVAPATHLAATSSSRSRAASASEMWTDGRDRAQPSCNSFSRTAFAVFVAPAPSPRARLSPRPPPTTGLTP